jgi:uncharacterized protein (DUF2384 family)
MSTGLFSTVPKDHLSLYDGNKLDYGATADFLHFNKEDVAKASVFSKTSVRFDEEKMSTELKERIKEWATLLNIVAGFFKGDAQKTYTWFVTLNPMLGNVAPRDMIRFGRYKKLLKFVMNAIAENKG